MPASVAARKAGPYARPCDYRQGSPWTCTQFVAILTIIPFERPPGSAAAGALRCAPALPLQHARRQRPGCHPRAQSAPGPRDRYRAADFRQRELLNRASRSFESVTNSARVSDIQRCPDADLRGTQAIIPVIEGSAFATGFNTLWIDPSDPFPSGFQVV